MNRQMQLKNLANSPVKWYKKNLSIVHFVIKAPKLVQMIVTIYRVHGKKNYQLSNPRWPPKIKMAAMALSFFTFSPHKF